ncbi:hypothetical protein RYX36_006938, partial [Vicia faba]
MGVRVHDLWTVKERNGSLYVELAIQDAKVACANIALRDYHGSIIYLALWDVFASKLFAFLSENTNVTPSIIVTTHGWCKLSA